MEQLYKALLAIHEAIKPALRGTEWRITLDIKGSSEVTIEAIKGDTIYNSVSIVESEHDSRDFELVSLMAMASTIDTVMTLIMLERQPK